MPFIHWTQEQLYIGIDDIDQQHEQILTLVNQIGSAIVNRLKDQDMNDLCTQLICISREHFDREERLMLKYFYPDTEAHIGQHMAYMTIISTLMNNLREKQYSNALDTLKYLSNWFMDHIINADGYYAKFIQHKIA